MWVCIEIASEKSRTRTGEEETSPIIANSRKNWAEQNVVQLVDISLRRGEKIMVRLSDR